MTKKRIDLSEDVHILELEVRKLELENRLAQLKIEQFIDGGCVGCAGPCNVVDIAAKLQKELDACHLTIKNFKVIETRETDRLHKTILDMDVTISDLMDNDRIINGFLDEYRLTVDNRDKTIEDYKETIHIERVDRAAEKEMINHKFCEDLRKKNAIIEELKDRNSEDLNELYAIDKAERNKLSSTIKDLNLELTKKRAIIDDITKLRVNEVEKTESLEAELSTRKKDSEVLKKIRALVDDWSVNKKGGRQSFFILSEIDDMLKSTQHIDETQDITVTVAFLELP